MSGTFEAGQKVKVFDEEEGEITYGPVRSTFGGYTGYVVRVDGADVWHKGTDLSAIPEPPKFAVGDVVELITRRGARATVEYGPFDDRDVYVVKLVDKPADADDVRTFTALASVLRTVVDPEPVKVGDRVRIVRATHAEECHGREGVVTSTSADWRADRGDAHPYIVRLDNGDGTVYVAELERVDSPSADTYEYDGVTYDLSATHRDKDGDPWTFKQVDGRVAAGCNGFDPEHSTVTLESVVDEFGPLTRVND